MRFLILIPCILDFVLILKGEIGCPSFFLSKRFSTEKLWIDRKSLGTWDWNEDNINIGTVPKYHVNRRANEFRLWSIFAGAFEGFPSSHRPIKYSASAHGSMTSCCLAIASPKTAVVVQVFERKFLNLDGANFLLPTLCDYLFTKKARFMIRCCSLSSVILGVIA